MQMQMQRSVEGEDSIHTRGVGKGCEISLLNIIRLHY